ncbi:MAG: DNA methyltransferase [Planctomycetota bacterium]
MTTTLWSYPSQHYEGRDGRPVGVGERNTQGDPLYVGATPSWVIWQLLTRFTKAGDVVLDPMCGSGTTLDVCRDLGRKGVGFDLGPTRAAIRRADARSLPIDDASADFVFIDPPYSTHVRYTEHERCIGELSALPDSEDGGRAYYEAMELVIGECARALKPGGHMGLYVSDSFKPRKGKRGASAGVTGSFAPIGFELFGMLCTRLTPVDIVCVTRGNRKLNKGVMGKAAREGGYWMRGFNYLFVMRKPTGSDQAARKNR